MLLYAYWLLLLVLHTPVRVKQLAETRYSIMANIIPELKFVSLRSIAHLAAVQHANTWLKSEIDDKKSDLNKMHITNIMYVLRGVPKIRFRQYVDARRIDIFLYGENQARNHSTLMFKIFLAKSARPQIVLVVLCQNLLVQSSSGLKSVRTGHPKTRRLWGAQGQLYEELAGLQARLRRLLRRVLDGQRLHKPDLQRAIHAAPRRA